MGWQWLFLIEGLPAVLLGGVALVYLTDRPEIATWLTNEERDWLVEQLAREEKPNPQASGRRFRRTDPGSEYGCWWWCIWA